MLLQEKLQVAEDLFSKRSCFLPARAQSAEETAQLAKVVFC